MIIADNILKIETTFVIMGIYNATFEVGLSPRIELNLILPTRSLNLEAVEGTDANGK